MKGIKYGLKNLSLNTKLIRNIGDIITETLNMCIIQQLFPDLLQIATVTPLFKNTDSTLTENDTPLTMNTAIGKNSN